MYYRIFFPVVGLILQREAFKQMFLVLENGLQRGQGQRFSETTGPGEEINSIRLFYLIPDIVRLVDIRIAALYELLKSIYACRQVFHFTHPDLSLSEYKT